MKKKNKLLNGLFSKNEAKKGSNKQIDDGKTSGSNDSRKRNTIDGVFRDDPPADELHLYDLDEADELFMKSQYNEALEKYQDALPFAEIKFGPSNPTVGDIHVKISTIQQGKSKLQPAVEHLTNAMEIYKRAINESSGDNSEYVLVLQRKLVEIMTCIANIYVDMGEMEKANDMYHDAIESSKGFFPSNDPHIITSLNNYANFLSMCKKDHETALSTLKEALKLQKGDGEEGMDPVSATTLNNMGKVYMRISVSSNKQSGHDDAKRAEACFIKALQLYRLSMVRSGNSRVSETLYNLSHAREWQNERKGILKNVRFEAPTEVINNLHEEEEEDEEGGLSFAVNSGEEDDVDENELRRYSKEFSENLKKNRQIGHDEDTGFLAYLFGNRCGELGDIEDEDIGEDESAAYEDYEDESTVGGSVVMASPFVLNRLLG